jgi:hypothetical protein
MSLQKANRSWILQEQYSILSKAKGGCGTVKGKVAHEWQVVVPENAAMKEKLVLSLSKNRRIFVQWSETTDYEVTVTAIFERKDGEKLTEVPLERGALYEQSAARLILVVDVKSAGNVPQEVVVEGVLFA